MKIIVFRKEFSLLNLIHFLKYIKEEAFHNFQRKAGVCALNVYASEQLQKKKSRILCKVFLHKILLLFPHFLSCEKSYE